MREKGFDLTAYHKTERVVCIGPLFDFECQFIVKYWNLVKLSRCTLCDISNIKTTFNCSLPSL